MRTLAATKYPLPVLPPTCNHCGRGLQPDFEQIKKLGFHVIDRDGIKRLPVGVTEEATPRLTFKALSSCSDTLLPLYDTGNRLVDKYLNRFMDRSKILKAVNDLAPLEITMGALDQGKGTLEDIPSVRDHLIDRAEKAETLHQAMTDLALALRIEEEWGGDRGAGVIENKDGKSVISGLDEIFENGYRRQEILDKMQLLASLDANMQLGIGGNLVAYRLLEKAGLTGLVEEVSKRPLPKSAPLEATEPPSHRDDLGPSTEEAV